MSLVDYHFNSTLLTMQIRKPINIEVGETIILLSTLKGNQSVLWEEQASVAQLLRRCCHPQVKYAKLTALIPYQRILETEVYIETDLRSIGHQNIMCTPKLLSFVLWERSHFPHHTFRFPSCHKFQSWSVLGLLKGRLRRIRTENGLMYVP